MPKKNFQKSPLPLPPRDFYLECAKNFAVVRQELNSENDAAELFKKCISIHNKFDAIILNAGSTDRTAWSQWMNVMNVNINVPSEIIRRFDNSIADNGNIIMISSAMSIYPHAVSVPYTVSKSAVNGLTMALGKEYCDRNIRVNAIVPGFVDTPWQKNKPQAQRQRICDKTALHRFAEPEEIADVAFNIINSTYVNGALIKVDGGYCYK